MINEDIWKKREKFNTKYFLSFAAYHQKELHYGFELSNSLLAQYRIFSKAFLEGGIGIGYLHTIEDAPVYKIKDGKYVQVRDWGRPQITVNSSIGAGFNLTEGISIVTKYKFLLQLPFARKAGIFIIPHARFSLRAILNINGE